MIHGRFPGKALHEHIHPPAARHRLILPPREAAGGPPPVTKPPEAPPAVARRGARFSEKILDAPRSISGFFPIITENHCGTGIDFVYVANLRVTYV